MCVLSFLSISAHPTPPPTPMWVGWLFTLAWVCFAHGQSLETNKERLGIAQYFVAQTSLEHVIDIVTLKSGEWGSGMSGVGWGWGWGMHRLLWCIFPLLFSLPAELPHMHAPNICLPGS
jgi:hypothetical protein